MDNLQTTRQLSSESDLKKVIAWQNESWRLIASRLNWLLERIHVETVSGENCMVIEHIKPGQNKNEAGNWRLILKADNDSELQENINGTWTMKARWHGT